MSLSNFFNSNQKVSIGTDEYFLEDGVYTSKVLSTKSSNQKQTENTFGFKWNKEDTFDSEQSLKRVKKWLLERYLEPEKWIKSINSNQPISILDAGCGAGMSGFEYWSSNSEKINYFGVDISEAVYVASKRAQNIKFNDVAFLRSSVDNLPFTSPQFDIIFSEGVLHHTDSTLNAFNHLSQLLNPNGLFMFYIYRKKGPIREFTDDYIRDILQNLSSEDAWNKLEPLSKLGIELGKLNLEIEIPENIDILQIPAGKINIQRLFYWHIFKAFYDPNLSFAEMHHINFDWYAPKNAHRHTIEEVQTWCAQNKLKIEHLREEPAGITCIARKI